jgi:hypothetical protein
MISFHPLQKEETKMTDPFQDTEPRSAPPKLNFFSKLQIKIAGADPDFVLKECPEDIGTLKSGAGIALGSFGYNSVVFGAIGTHFFGQAGHSNLGIYLGATALSSFILAIDSYVFFRCSYLAAGYDELEEAGLDVSLPDKLRRTARRFLGIRIGQSCALGLIVGVCFSLLMYAHDIGARVQIDRLKNNAPIVQQINDQLDSDAKITADAINSATTQIATLNKQIATARQIEFNNARRNGGGGSVNFSNGPTIRTLESRRATEENKLARLKDDLSKLRSGRGDRMRASLDGDPTALRANDGVLGQINALEEIAGDDWKIAFIMFLIEIVAVGFDLAPVLAKMNYLPTTYSALLARDHLLRMQRIVDTTVSPDQDDEPPSPANDNQLRNGKDHGTGPFANDNEPIQPPKRKRGRPPKNPPTNGQIV